MDQDQKQKSLVLEKENNEPVSKKETGFKNFLDFLNNYSNFLIAIATVIIAIATIIICLFNKDLVNVTKRSLEEMAASTNAALEANKIAFESNSRAEKTFIGQEKPLISVTPVGIRQSKNSKTGHFFAITSLSVVNYSGFIAKNIGFDIKYGSNSWINEWIKADRNKNDNGVEIKKLYFSSPPVSIKSLAPGKTDNNIIISNFAGALNIDEICTNLKNQSLVVKLRIKWENEYSHIFDEIHEYNLICTMDDTRKGRSFTFIPHK